MGDQSGNQWKSNDARLHNSYSDASHSDFQDSQVQDASNIMSGRSKGGIGNFATGILFIFLIIPKFLAMVAGSTFAFLTKLGVFGKILQTLIFSLVCVVVLAFSTAMLSSKVLEIMAIPIFVIAALWFWMFHHDEIKVMAVREYANKVEKSLFIVFYGMVLNIVFVTFFAKILFGEMGSIIAMFALMLILFAAAILVYWKGTKSHREEVAKTRKNVKLKKTILIIATIYMVTSVGASIITNLTGIRLIEKNIDLTGRSKAAAHGTISYFGGTYEGELVNGKPHGIGKATTSSGKVFEGYYKNNYFVGLPLLQNALLYNEPSENSTVIRTMNKGDFVIILSDWETKGNLVPVRHIRDDVEKRKLKPAGWVNSEFIDRSIGPAAGFSESNRWVDWDNWK